MDTFCQTVVPDALGVGVALPELTDYLTNELAARVTYALACDRIELLRAFEQEHRAAADLLTQHIRQLGGEPACECQSLGAWSGAARSAPAGRPAAVLAALRDAEKAVLDQYEHRVANLDPEGERLIHKRLIPAQHRRIRALDQLIATIEQPVA